MENTNKIEEFVNIFNNIRGRSDAITTNKAGVGYGFANGRASFSSSGYGAGVGVEIHRNGCFGDGMACKLRKINYNGRYR